MKSSEAKRMSDSSKRTHRCITYTWDDHEKTSTLRASRRHHRRGTMHTLRTCGIARGALCWPYGDWPRPSLVWKAGF
ncbi:hypothetical protein AB1N83_004064 [Pleurotus pulmonarius]